MLTREPGARPLWWVLHIQQGFLHNSSLQVPNLGNLATRRTWSESGAECGCPPGRSQHGMEDSGNNEKCVWGPQGIMHSRNG